MGEYKETVEIQNYVGEYKTSPLVHNSHLLS